MSGAVSRHFWQRFGAAILFSIVDGAVQTGGGAIVLSPAASQGVATEVLKSTVAIPPTVVKKQGDRIQVIVARDVDFRSVYALSINRAGG
jgi:type IV secretion system protein VirB10